MAFFAKVFSTASRIIRGRNLSLDARVDALYIICIASSKLFGLFRAGLRGRWRIFFGAGVTIRCGRLLKIGKGSIIGDNVYIDALGEKGVNLSERVSIGSYSRLSVSGSLSSIGCGISIGQDSAIGDFSHIGGAGEVIIGKDTIAGAYLSIHPENHNFDTLNDPIRLQGTNRKGIEIGDNCWLGAKVTILDGTKLGDGCVVAAGAVLRGKFPDNVIVGGVPAKILKQRHNERQS